MLTKHAAAALILSALAITAAQAQSTTAPVQSPAAVAKMTHRGEWRASKVVGLTVYNQQKDKIGEINEIIVGPSGELAGFVVGVGGFLGMGEHDVLLSSKEVRFMIEGNAPYAPNTGSAAGAPARTGDAKWYPDYAVVNATKDQLKALPQFKYSSYN